MELNDELREESNYLKFRLADEQDEINRINGELKGSMELNDSLIDENEKYKQKIDKLKDIITLFDKELEFNMLGVVSIASVSKRLKDIIA